MPNYLITDNETGRKFKVTGDSPPTEAEAAQIFADMGLTGSKTPFPSAAEAEKMRQKFYDEEASTKTKLRDTAQAIGAKAMPYIRPALEVGGAVAGGFLGGAADLPTGILPGAAVGGAVGYATGKSAADALERGLGLKEQASVPQALAEPIKNLAEGAAFESGGALIGKAIEKGLPVARRLLQQGLPLTQRNASAKAAEQLADLTTSDVAMQPLKTTRPAQSVVDALEEVSPYGVTKATQNMAQSDALLQRIGATERPTLGQQSGDYATNYFEQGATSAYPEFGAKLKANDAAINEKAVANMINATGTGKKLPDMIPDNEIGDNILVLLESRMKPVRGAMQKMEESLPDVTMQTPTMYDAIKEQAQRPELTTDARDMLSKLYKIFETRAPGANTTSKELVGIHRDINQMIDDALSSGKNDAAAALIRVKQGLQADMNKLGQMAKTGEIKLYNGKRVDVDKLANKLESNLVQIAEQEQKAAVDMDAVIATLKEQGIHPSTYTQVDRFDKGAAQRAEAAYTRLTGKEPPLKQDPGAQVYINRLTEENNNIRKILGEVSPMQDIGAQFRAYNRYASKEYFNKYDVGDIERSLRRGTELNKRSMKSENIPGQFMTPSGAISFINATGKDSARQIMLPHVENQIRKLAVTVEGPDGIVTALDVPKVGKWLRDNQQVLQMYGLDGDVKQYIKEAMPDYLKASFARMGEDMNGTVIMSPTQARKMLNELAPTLRQAGYTSEQVQAFKDYRATIDMLARNKNVTYSGNSITAEKLNAKQAIDDLFNQNKGLPGMGPRIAEKLSTAITMALAGGGAVAGHGIMSPVTAAAGAMAGMATKGAIEAQAEAARQIFRNIMTDALYNPATAKALADAAKMPKGMLPPEISGKIAGEAAKVLAMTAKGITPPQHQPADIDAELKKRGY